METIKKLLEKNVSSMTEKKNGLTYLSWAMAWKCVLEIYPGAKYSILKNEDNIPLFGNKELGYMVYTTVTIEDLTHEMWLPVLDFKNKAMTNPNMFDINKSIMRCLAKNLAMFGLGLNVYTGEDYPISEDDFKEEVIAKINRLPKERKEKLMAHYGVKSLGELKIEQLQDANNKL